MAPTTATAEIDLRTTTNMGTKHASESSSGDADPKRVPELILDGQPPAGSPPMAVKTTWPFGRDGSSTRPGTKTGERRSGFGGRDCERGLSTCVSSRATTIRQGALCLAPGSTTNVVGLPTISTTLRNGDQFPTLDALTRLMEAVATARLRQVRDSLDSTE